MLVGQEQAESVLARAMRQGRVSHAYLFVGPEAVGKITAATLLAQALNCESQNSADQWAVSREEWAKTSGPEPLPTAHHSLLTAPTGERLSPCGVCGSCRRIAAGTHPDVHVITPGSKSGQNISVEQIRDVRQDVARRPIMGRRKLYLMPAAEAMNEEAANTLLKTLEEPPSYVTLILMATSPTRVLPTILSRCQVVRFGLVPALAIRDWLVADGVAPETAEGLALAADGRPGLALRWSREPEVLERRRQLLDLLAEVSSRRERARQAPGQAIAALRLAERARSLVGTEEGEEAEPVSKAAAKPAFRRLLAMVRSYYRDLLLLAQGAPDDLVGNADVLPVLRKGAGLSTPAELLAALAAVDRCQQFLERNVAPPLALETLFLELLCGTDA